MKRSNWGRALLFAVAIVVLTVLLIIISILDDVMTDNEFIPVLLIGAVIFLIWWRKRRKRKEKETEQRILQQKEKSERVAEIDPNSAILYLRPFKADANDVVSVRRGEDRTAKHSVFKKFKNRFDTVRYAGKDYYDIEALICAMLCDRGVPIAIGDPREQMLNTGVEDGAARIYVDEAVWKQKVEYYFQHAKLVVLYVDFTKGVAWEISRAVEQYAEKVIFLPRLYNKRGAVVGYLAASELLFIIWPILLFRRLLLFPHFHRGPRYYQEWKRVFRFSITDHVAAVRIINGKPVITKTRNGLLISQLNAIMTAIQNSNS